MYGLLDGNNFYASCERVFRPDLVGRPIVVLSSNDGACIARSNEAKALGIEMAAPWFKVKHLERTAGLVAVSANFELYSSMSGRMMSVAGRFAPEQQVYSIDECFLGFDGVRGDLVAIGRDLRATVLRETGLPTSVGFGATKTLAKLANNIGKTADRKPGSYPAHLSQVCNLGALPQHELDAVLAATEIRSVWGIGRKISEKLIAGGVRTVLDFVRCDATTIRRQFSVVLEKTLLELRGVSCLDLGDVDEPARNKGMILVSRSFGTSITEVDGIIEAVSEFTSRAAEKLRAQGSTAGVVTAFFTTSPFRKDDRQHAVNATTPLVRPTADSRVLVAAAVAAVRQNFRPGFRYAKAGATLSDLQLAGVHQGELDLFSEAEPAGPLDAKRAAGQAALMHAMDGLNKRFGRDSVRIGSAALVSGNDDVRVWSTRQERRTPRYTTRWDEMRVVKA